MTLTNVIPVFLQLGPDLGEAKGTGPQLFRPSTNRGLTTKSFLSCTNGCDWPVAHRPPATLCNRKCSKKVVRTLRKLVHGPQTSQLVNPALVSNSTQWVPTLHWSNRPGKGRPFPSLSGTIRPECSLAFFKRLKGNTQHCTRQVRNASCKYHIITDAWLSYLILTNRMRPKVIPSKIFVAFSATTADSDEKFCTFDHQSYLIITLINEILVGPISKHDDVTAVSVWPSMPILRAH